MSVRFEIDRSAGLITAVHRSLFFRKKRSYPAGDVLAVKLLKQGVAVEEGYGTIRYSIVLEGRGEAVELMSAEDEREVESCRRELVEFLEHYRKQTGSAAGEAETIYEEEQ